MPVVASLTELHGDIDWGVRVQTANYFLRQCLSKFKLYMTGFLVFQIMSELMANGVQIYHFPVDDETVADTNNTMNVSKVAF